MGGAKGACLIDAGWHGKVTGLREESRNPSQMLRNDPTSMRCRMRPEMHCVAKNSHGDVQPTLHDQEHPQHRRNCRIHVVGVGLCTEVSYVQNYKEKYEQHCTLPEHLKNAQCADVQLHLLILASTGGLFKLTALHLKRLHLSHSKVDSLLQDMHWTALGMLEQIVGTRRRPEHYGSQGMQRRPLSNKRRHVT